MASAEDQVAVGEGRRSRCTGYRSWSVTRRGVSARLTESVTRYFRCRDECFIARVVRFFNTRSHREGAVAAELFLLLRRCGRVFRLLLAAFVEAFGAEDGVCIVMARSFACFQAAVDRLSLGGESGLKRILAKLRGVCPRLRAAFVVCLLCVADVVGRRECSTPLIIKSTAAFANFSRSW